MNTGARKLWYWPYYFLGLSKSAYFLLTHKKICATRIGQKPILSPESGNQRIKNLIQADTPFCVLRFGGVELAVTADAIGIELKLRRKIRQRMLRKLCVNAGFFPQDQHQAYRYGLLMAELSKEADLLGYWHYAMEDYMVRYFATNCTPVKPASLSPYVFDAPWSASLKGKRVLVIHPFAQTISRQYEKRTLLFQTPETLPNFHLITIKAVQSSALEKTDYDSWFAALEHMYEQAIATSFDIALIGCGAYGFALAAMLKKAGKSAIHMGAAVQRLFGIKGSRWDHKASSSQNTHWVYPSPEETPANYKLVEGGCYWQTGEK